MELKTGIGHFIDTLDRSPKTLLAYQNALIQFIKSVGEGADLNTDTYIRFLDSIKKEITFHATCLQDRGFEILCILPGWQLVRTEGSYRASYTQT